MDGKMFIALFLLAALIGGIYRWRKRKRIANLLLVLFTCLLALVVTEYVYRIFIKPPQVITTVNDFYQMDSIVGFHFDPGIVRAVEHIEGGDTLYNTHYTILPDTNHFGISYPQRKAWRADSSTIETVFLGCSLTFGEGLADEETLPYLFGQLSHSSTVNRACNGMGTHQVYRLFETEYAQQDNSRRVFVYSFSSDHLFRALCLYRWNVAGPWYEIEGDTLVNRGPFYKTHTVAGHRLSQVFSGLGTFTCIRDNIERVAESRSKKHVTAKDLMPAYMMLQNLAEKIQRTGGRLIILNWDEPGTDIGSTIINKDITSKKLNTIMAKTNTPVLPVWSVINRSDAANFIPHDGHPTVKANRKLAQLIAGELNTLRNPEFRE